MDLALEVHLVDVDVADASAADAEDALQAAATAGYAWAGTSPRARWRALRAAYDAMLANRAELADLLTLETGGPLAQSLVEVIYTAKYLEWFAEEAVRIDGRYGLSPGGGTRIQVSYTRSGRAC